MVQRARQGAFEHAGIELVWLAVGIDVGARKAGGQQGKTQIGRTAEQFVDERVLGPPQGGDRHGGQGEEIRRVK